MIKAGKDPSMMIKGGEQLKMIKDAMERPAVKEADPLFRTAQGIAEEITKGGYGLDPEMMQKLQNDPEALRKVMEQ